MKLLADLDHASQQAAEPEQGVIEEARRRQRSRRSRAGLAAVLLLAAAGGLIGLAGGRAPSAEAPLHLPPEPAPLPPNSASAPGGVTVRLSPDLGGAQAGWCMTIIERQGVSGTCGPLPTRNHPLIRGGTGVNRGERDATTVSVTGPRVAYVLVNGTRRVPTITQAGLPFGMRVAVVHTPYHAAPTPRLRLQLPELTDLEAEGAPIRESPDYGSGLPFRDWNPPSTPIKGACQLHAQGLAGLKAEWGQVAMAIRPYAGAIVGRGFLSCIDTEYYIPGHSVRAAVLLDAGNPGHTAPAKIPGLAPIPQAPGLYNGSDYSFQGPITAKREGNTWVVVAGGGRNAEEARIKLLRHLTATIQH